MACPVLVVDKDDEESTLGRGNIYADDPAARSPAASRLLLSPPIISCRVLLGTYTSSVVCGLQLLGEASDEG